MARLRAESAGEKVHSAMSLSSLLVAPSSAARARFSAICSSRHKQRLFLLHTPLRY